MSAPYLRFMNGDMSLWDFVGEMDSQQRSQNNGQGRHGRHGPASFTTTNNFYNGWQEPGPFAHGFTHRPHPRHRGPHGPEGWRRGRGHPHHNTPANENYVLSETVPDGEPPQYEAMNEDSDTPIRMEDKEKDNEKAKADDKDNDSDPEVSTPRVTSPNEDDDSGSGSDEQNHRHGSRRHGGHGHGRRGGWGGRGGRWRGPHGHEHPHPHPYGFGGPWGHGPGPWGRGGFGGGRRGPGAGGCPMNFNRAAGPQGQNFIDMMRPFVAGNLEHLPEGVRDMVAQFLGPAPSRPDAQETGVTANEEGTRGENDNNNTNTHSQGSDIDFRPAADIYDAADAYIVHLVLPGAKKEDINLSWDADRCELQVTGVIAREGDEATLQALALAERDVGVFERRVKLGTDKIDHEAIAARMDNGILIATVPKKKEDDSWTEVREIDIQ